MFLKTRKTTSEIHGILKIAFANNAITEHRLFLVVFLISNTGKLWLKSVIVRSSLHRWHKSKYGGSVQNW